MFGNNIGAWKQLRVFQSSGHYPILVSKLPVLKYGCHTWVNITLSLPITYIALIHRIKYLWIHPIIKKQDILEYENTITIRKFKWKWTVHYSGSEEAVENNCVRVLINQYYNGLILGGFFCTLTQDLWGIGLSMEPG